MCIYNNVWCDNARRHDAKTSLLDVMHKYSRDYKVVFVGDAPMSPYEIVYPCGSVEYMRPESGERFRETYEKVIWIHPVPEKQWQHTQSTGITRQLLEDNMYPLTLKGLEEGMSYLSK